MTPTTSFRSPRLVAALGLSITWILASVGCGGGAETGTSGEDAAPVVHTVNYPLMYFAERIGGEQVDVRFLAPGDGDPAFWTPDDEAVEAMQSADLVLLNGAGYAKWLGGVTLPDSILADTSAAFAGDYITIEETGTHSHGDEGDHSHAGTAFTTWLDMKQARMQAEAVRDALIGLGDLDEAALRANADELLAEIDALDAELTRLGEAIGDRPLVASHPVYQYLARAYGLAIEPLMWEPEVVPDEAALAELESLREGHPAEWMVWEGEPAAESLVLLQDRGMRNLVFDPCGNRPDEGDWMSVMQANIEPLERVAE